MGVEEFMRFKVEILLNGKIIRDIFFADNLENLAQQITKSFPKGKIITIIGG